MKTLTIVCLALMFSAVAFARILHPLSYQELSKRSDLVAIATPCSSKDVPDEPAMGIVRTKVATEFRILVVLKGDFLAPYLTLDHHREPKGVTNGSSAIDLPPLLPSRLAFLMFLQKDADGHFVPVRDADENLAVMQLPVRDFGDAAGPTSPDPAAHSVTPPADAGTRAAAVRGAP